MTSGYGYTHYPNSSQSVRTVQKYLRQLSYFDKRIPPVPIDGIYGSDTRKAVGIFQSLNGLPKTGTVDYPTWVKLRDDYILSVALHSATTQPSLFPYPEGEREVRIGDNGFITAVIQHMLDEISPSFTGTELSEQTKKDGIFNAETQNAVMNFQRCHGIPETGAVDRDTWSMIVEDYNSGQHSGE